MGSRAVAAEEMVATAYLAVMGQGRETAISTITHSSADDLHPRSSFSLSWP